MWIHLFMMAYKSAKNGCTFALFAQRVSMTMIDAYIHEERKEQ